MKQTAADLMGPRGYSSQSMGVGTDMENAPPSSNKEGVFTVRIILEANEVEILDNKVVIEKRVIAHDRREALDKCGFTVKD